LRPTRVGARPRRVISRTRDNRPQTGLGSDCEACPVDAATEVFSAACPRHRVTPTSPLPRRNIRNCRGVGRGRAALGQWGARTEL